MSDFDEIHKKIDRLESKQDLLLDKLADTNIILAKNTISLEIHESRTTASETRITTLEEESIRRQASLNAWLKFGGFLVGFSTIVATVAEIIIRLH